MPIEAQPEEYELEPSKSYLLKTFISFATHVLKDKSLTQLSNIKESSVRRLAHLPGEDVQRNSGIVNFSHREKIWFSIDPDTSLVVKH